MKPAKGSPPLPPLQHEEGWQGAFTREQAPGAYPNGTRVFKYNSEPGDGTREGTPGTVLGSMSHPKVHKGAIFYFIEWATRPRWAIGVLHTKLKDDE